MSDERRPSAFLIPIEGLKVPGPWRVGKVVIHPGTAGRDLIASSPPFDGRDGAIERMVHEILDDAGNEAIAEVRDEPTIDGALEAVRASLDVLRLFQLARRVTQTTSFGLSGDLRNERIRYITVADRSAPGVRFRGESPGWTFDATALADWHASPAFQYLSVVNDGPVDEGARRAFVGARLLARAAREQSPDLKMLGVASALEAWLMRCEPGAQTLRLARHVAWFGCGLHDSNLCGRSRPICPYLRLDPTRASDRRRLVTLRQLGNEHVTWRCSEWHRVMDWYDARSSAAHGDPTSVDAKHANQAEYWVVHYLMEPILLWLRDHPNNPIDDLESTLAGVAEPARWHAIVAALDQSPPPTSPPLP